MSSVRHWLLDAKTGPFRVVAGFSATPEERKAAHPKSQARRMLRALATSGGLGALAGLVGEDVGSTAATIERRLELAIESGALLLVPGWTWFRRRTPPADRPISLPLPPEAAPAPRAKKAVFEVLIVDLQTGHPIPGVPLEIEPPDGPTRRLETDSQGAVRIADLDPGTCTVRTIIDGARVQNSYAPVAASGALPEPTRSAPPQAAFVVAAITHRIARGQTPVSIAKEYGVAWEDIALFNWGTADRDELEQRYRKTLGSTHTAPDGSVIFDDDDDPGLILIPRAWESTLAVGRSHRILVSALRTVFLSLKNEVGLSIPAARYEALFADGSIRSGRLGPAGVARLAGVPEGAFSVSYPDEADILAKSLAVSVRKAFDEQATSPLFTLLMQDPEIVERATAAYDQYFNDLTGDGLVADIDQVVTDPDARRPLLALCAMAGLGVEGSESVVVENLSGAVDPGTPSIDQGVGR
jgi:hypothetical protein